MELSEVSKEQTNALMKAESKLAGEDRGCYCPFCCKMAAEAANEIIWQLLCENDKITDEQRKEIYWDTEYIVLPSGIHSKIIHGCDLPKYGERKEDSDF